MVGLLRRFLRKNPILKIPSVTDMTLDRLLRKIFRDIDQGKVLDIGSGGKPYIGIVPQTEYIALDIQMEHHPTVVADAHRFPFADNTFDTVVGTELLEHLHNPGLAVSEIYRVLKPGGNCIVTTPFLYPYHPTPEDHFRFTPDSYSVMFGQFSGTNLSPYGNRVQAAWQILSVGRPSIILNIFNPLFRLVSYTDEKAPLGYVMIAQK